MEMLQKIKENQKGQTLLEVVIALTALLLILAAISIVVTTSVSNSTFIKNQNKAGKYAQEGMEYVRNLKVSNYADFIANYPTGTYCLSDDQPLSLVSVAQIGPCRANVENSLIREVLIETDAAKCPSGRKVTVTVRWTGGKCPVSDVQSERYCHKSQVVSCLVDNNLNPTPTINP